MRVCRLTALLLIAALGSAPAFANLAEKIFPGKTEDAVAAEFEAGLPAYLAAQLKEPVKPRAHIEDGKHDVYVELTELNEDESTWQTLVVYAWYPEKTEYAYTPYGKSYKLKISEMPAASVAGWYDAARRPVNEVVGLAFWLAGKKEFRLANAVLATFGEAKKDLKPEIDAWLCEKNGWTLPKDGLEAVATMNIDSGEAGFLYFTPEARSAYVDELDDQAKDMFKDLEGRQGGDTKSKPGYRKRPPTMRLDMLQKRIERYRQAYAGTDFIEKKSNEKKLAALEEAVAGDLKYIETEKFKAERLGIDGDWLAAAKAYDALLRLNPHDPDLITATAEAYNKGAVVSDGGRKAEEPSAAGRAAVLYEELIEIFPKALAYHNFAGLNWLASGDKKRAKNHHEEVIRRTDDRKDLSENEKKNRDYAENQLKMCK